MIMIGRKYCMLSLFFLIFFTVSCKTVPVAMQEEKPAFVPALEYDNYKAEFAGELETFLKDGDYESAVNHFEKVKPELKDDPALKTLKLSILISANKIKEASAYASELEKENPENLDVLFAQAMLAQAENNLKKKNAYLEKILAKNPKNTQALVEQGMDLYGKKRYSDASKKFLEAYSANPKSANALVGLARVYYMQEKMSEAEVNLNTALSLEPENSAALAELARIKSETGRMDDAVKDITRAISLSPETAGYQADLGSYYMRMGKKEDARAAFTEAVKTDPDYYLAYIYRAGLNDELGYKELALKDYLTVCSLYPAYYFAFEGAGVLFWEKGDWQNAGNAFIKALARAPEAYQYALLTMICYIKMNQKVEAKSFMQKYLKTVDRSKRPVDYMMCRLFSDFAGDTEVYNKAGAETNFVKKGRMFFYLAVYYDIINKKTLSDTCYAEVLAIKNPDFFEYRFVEKKMGHLKPKSKR